MSDQCSLTLIDLSTLAQQYVLFGYNCCCCHIHIKVSTSYVFLYFHVKKKCILVTILGKLNVHDFHLYIILLTIHKVHASHRTVLSNFWNAYTYVCVSCVCALVFFFPELDNMTSAMFNKVLQLSQCLVRYSSNSVSRTKARPKK